MNRYAICLSLYGTSSEIVNDILNHDADLYEIRVDLSSNPDAAAIRAATPKPLIFTTHERPETLAPFDAYAQYLDAGLNVLPSRSARQIISFHGDDHYPADLLNQPDSSKLYKIVLGTADYSNIFHLIELNRSGNVIAFAMGEAGAFSRVLSVFYGAPWLYASLPGRATAEGQFTIQELLELYRLRRFGSTPLVFGVIGNPVSHSRSPSWHNDRFAREEKPWIYLPFLCDDLRSLFTLAPRWGIAGFSITHPFKDQVVSLLSRCSNEVRALNACNTAFYGSDGWEGINTDVAGAQAVLNQIGTPLLQQSRVLLLGAGGAAKAMAYALNGAAKELIVLNRTESNAAEIAQRYGCKFGNIGDFANYDYDVLIQTTPLGIQQQESPVPLRALKPNKTVIDVIYNPPQTALLKYSGEIGCKIFNGELWFEAQAESQFRWWKEKEGEKRQPKG